MRDDKDSLHPADLSEMLTTKTNVRTRRVTLQFINPRPNQEGFCRVEAGPELLFVCSVFQLCGNIVVQYFAE